MEGKGERWHSYAYYILTCAQLRVSTTSFKEGHKMLMEIRQDMASQYDLTSA